MFHQSPQVIGCNFYVIDSCYSHCNIFRSNMQDLTLIVRVLPAKDLSNMKVITQILKSSDAFLYLLSSWRPRQLVYGLSRYF